MKEPSIQVTFRPFLLALRRTNEGDFVVTLSLAGAPTALVHSTASTEARVRTDTPTPCLQVGTAQFAVPTRQLARIGDWLAGQHAPATPMPLADEIAPPTNESTPDADSAPETAHTPA